MLVRIWKTDYDPAGFDRLNEYANRVSLPALSSRPGNRGVLFYQRDGQWWTLTIWENQAAIDALAGDKVYQETVAGILALDVLGKDQSVEICDHAGGIPLPV